MNLMNLYFIFTFQIPFSHGKTSLDLSLSVRFANLPPGAKLELIRKRNPIAGIDMEGGIGRGRDK